MALEVYGTRIERVGIIDDSEDTRATLGDDLADAAFIPQLYDGPFSSVGDLVSSVMANADAVVCDHHLTTRNFAPCSGAEAVAQWYRIGFPSVLITAWTKADIDHIRRYRRYIPALLPPLATPAEIAKGFESCVGEFRDQYLPSRRAWRTLVRIEQVDRTTQVPIVYATIPAWPPDEVVRFPIDIIPVELHQFARPDQRFYAKVNTGAESQEELFFEEFEFLGE